MTPDLTPNQPLEATDHPSINISFTSMKRFLQSFDVMMTRGCFLVDFSHEKIIANRSTSRKLSGMFSLNPSSIDFAAFRSLFSEGEELRIRQIQASALAFFKMTSAKERMNLCLSFDMQLVNAKGLPIIWHVKVVPYEFTNKGFLSISLCEILRSPMKICGQTRILDTKEKKTYLMIDNVFFLQNESFELNSEEKILLDGLFVDESPKNLCKHFDTSLSSLNRMKKKLFKKLGVATSRQAVITAIYYGYL